MVDDSRPVPAAGLTAPAAESRNCLVAWAQPDFAADFS